MQKSRAIIDLAANEIESISGGGSYGPKWEVIKWGLIGVGVGAGINVGGYLLDKVYTGSQGYVDTLQEYAGIVKDYAKIAGQIFVMRFLYCWYYSSGGSDKSVALSGSVGFSFKIKAE